jgi:hypothetical protein
VFSLLSALLFTTPAFADSSNDIKPGAVASCGGFLSKVWKDVTTAIKNLFAKKSPDFHNVAIIEDDGTLIGKDDMNLCGVAKVYYQSYPDDRHMLFVFGAPAGTYNAYYSSIRNDVKNIGRAVMDNSRQCGSNGVLMGFANMNTADKWKSFVGRNPLDGQPFGIPLLELWPLGVITHEIGHQWIAYIDKPVNGAMLVTDPNSVYRSHWDPFVDNGGSIMYGNNWAQITPGIDTTIFGKHIVVPATYTSVALPGGFTPLDKYLMGIIPSNQVPDFKVVKASSSHIWARYAVPLNTAAGSRVTVKMQDVLHVLGGERVPNYQSSQKIFKAAFIYVVPKGTKPNDTYIVEYFRRAIPQKLKKETGVFDMQTEIAPKGQAITPHVILPVVKPLVQPVTAPK